ncbi:hypothetical protein SUDANB105_07757 [Streptomyces sp. enrichment culture]
MPRAMVVASAMVQPGGQDCHVVLGVAGIEAGEHGVQDVLGTRAGFDADAGQPSQ